jgi:hypothetical protein
LAALAQARDTVFTLGYLILKLDSRTTASDRSGHAAGFGDSLTATREKSVHGASGNVVFHSAQLYRFGLEKQE